MKRAGQATGDSQSGALASLSIPRSLPDSHCSDCDSPLTLVDTTFDWLAKRWAGEIDFVRSPFAHYAVYCRMNVQVIWTGDSARHDIDSRIPRSFSASSLAHLALQLTSRTVEIVGLNENMVKRMQKAFGRRLPIVPSVGNNDVRPLLRSAAIAEYLSALSA